MAREPLLLWALLLGGCYASNVVARADRAVALDARPSAWTAAKASDVDGLFESVAIEGDAALSLRKVYYWFGRDGRYTGAALVEGDDGPGFQTLSGHWQLGASGLVLDDQPPAALEAAPDHLRIRAPNGALVLRRSSAQ